MKKTFLVSAALAILCIFLLSSCVVANRMTFTGSAAGKNHVDLAVDDFFVGVLEDLSDWEDKGNNDPILDVAVNDFVKKLNESQTTSGVRFLEAGPNTYLGDFSFADFNTLVFDLSNGLADQSILTMSSQDGRTHVEININMDNYEQLTKIIPFLADPNFEVYGPLYNHDLSEAEYLEMVSFILGEQCPSSIAKSSIRLQVAAPSDITGHNGTLKNAKLVEFTFPLIDFLLLHKPIQFWLEY